MRSETLILSTVLFLGITDQTAGVLDQKCQRYYATEIAELQQKFERTTKYTCPDFFPNCLDLNHPALTGWPTYLTNDPEIKTKSFRSAGLSIQFDRINVPDPTVYNLRNWVHITIEPREGPTAYISFIILQAVSSPLGLPFGEFRNDVECKEDEEYHQLISATYHRVVPCKYRPKSSLRHPNNYVLNVKLGTGVEYVDSIHVNFNWIDVMCQEVLAMQFLALVVHYDESSRSHYKAQYLSPVYSNRDPDSKIGIPYPWHYIWKDYTVCHYLEAKCPSNNPNQAGCFRGKENEDQYESLTIKKLDTPNNGELRILYNEEFHNCILNGVNGGLDKANGVECPPGPFYCSRSRAEAALDNRALITKDPKAAQDKYPGLPLEDSSESYRLAMSNSWAVCPTSLDGGIRYCPAHYNTILEDRCSQLFADYPGRSLERRFERKDEENSTTVAIYKGDGNTRVLSPSAGRSLVGVGHFGWGGEKDDYYGRKFGRSVASDPTTALKYMPDTNFAYALLQNLTVDQREIDRSEHGALMIAAFFVVISGGNFLARFFKESGGATEETRNGCCGFRCWILGHMAFSILSIFLIWMSLARPMDTLHCQKYDYNNTFVFQHQDNRTRVYEIRECVENPTTAVIIHKYFGYGIILFTHLTFVFGWIRPLRHYWRYLCTVIHAVSGHAIQFFVVAVISFTKICHDTFMFVILLMAMNIVLSGLATYSQRRHDKQIRLNPKRHHCPIVEHIEDEDCKIGNIVQLWAHWIGHLIVYICILFSYKIVIEEEKCWVVGS